MKSQVRPLPRLMVAPNGARRGPSDHPALPLTDDALIETAIACQQAGADGIHLHLRDDAGRHLLDAGRYQILLDRLADETPTKYLQVTSEAAGVYEPDEQRAMIRQLRPAHVSVALREMLRKPEDGPTARDFYHWASDNGVAIQHILYTPDEVRAFVDACERDLIPGPAWQLIFVQGSYATGADETVLLEQFLQPLVDAGRLSQTDWMVCAFGKQETACLVRAAELGGKARVGFENSLWNADGTVARDNAERVREVHNALIEFEKSGKPGAVDQ